MLLISKYSSNIDCCADQFGESFCFLRASTSIIQNPARFSYGELSHLHLNILPPVSTQKKGRNKIEGNCIVFLTAEVKLYYSHAVVGCLF